MGTNFGVAGLRLRSKTMTKFQVPSAIWFWLPRMSCLNKGAVGIGSLGAISPSSGLITNSNSTVLNGRPLDRDLPECLGRPIRLENDANCFALSEATDDAASSGRVVFGEILRTGVGRDCNRQGAYRREKPNRGVNGDTIRCHGLPRTSGLDPNAIVESMAA
jgi:hypothetical protein